MLFPFAFYKGATDILMSILLFIPSPLFCLSNNVLPLLPTIGGEENCFIPAVDIFFYFSYLNAIPPPPALLILPYFFVVFTSKVK